MIPLKTEPDILGMRKAGLMVWCSHQLVAQTIRIGVTTREIDRVVDHFFSANDAVAVFKGVPGQIPYPAATCISINEQVVHAIPGDRRLAEGDIVSVDTGCKIDGWCGDAADTYAVGGIDSGSQRLIDVTRETLDLAILSLGTAKYWSDVARQMERHVRKNGFSVVEVFVGHGIGREMHEEPQVPNFVYSGFLRHGDFPIRPGLVIAIEPMVNAGTKKVRQGADGWAMLTADGSRSAHIEHTVGILKSGPVVLTGPPLNESEQRMADDFFSRAAE